MIQEFTTVYKQKANIQEGVKRIIRACGYTVREEVTPVYWMILEILDKEPYLTGTEIAKDFGVTRSVFQKSLSDMEDKGYLEHRLTNDSNHHQKRYQLTPLGRMVLRDLRQQQEKVTQPSNNPLQQPTGEM